MSTYYIYLSIYLLLRMAARTDCRPRRTEQIFRRGQRECRLGRVRKKIGRAKKSKDEKPG